MKRMILAVFAAIPLLLCCTPDEGGLHLYPGDQGEGLNPEQPENPDITDPEKPAEPEGLPLPEFEVKPGAVLTLESGKRYSGTIVIDGLKAADNPFVITSSGAEPAILDAAGEGEGIFIRNSNGVIVRNLIIEADGRGGKRESDDPAKERKMRCGIYILNGIPGNYGNIRISNVVIRDIFYFDRGYVRNPEDTNTPNGTEAYGYGIRVVNYGTKENPLTFSGLKIDSCDVYSMSHTGIKLTGKNFGSVLDKKLNLTDVEISNTKVHDVGGPGIQMSLVKDVHIHHNTVDHSGSVKDSRSWKRGSGFWCWGADNILLEHNSFTNANGPMDSAGAHIDFNCSNIVLQYNYSSNNYGGFVEILGNNWNCSYRYNISVNDGIRTRKNTEGKILWLSGYVGSGNPPKGPYRSYIYNNTIYVSSRLDPRFSFVSTMEGALVANNIFYIQGATKVNLDKNRTPEELGLIFDNNLCISADVLPGSLKAKRTLIGNPGFVSPGADGAESYIPSAKELINKGIQISKLPGDEIGLKIGLEVKEDFFGKPITSPIIGAAVCR